MPDRIDLLMMDDEPPAPPPERTEAETRDVRRLGRVTGTETERPVGNPRLALLMGIEEIARAQQAGSGIYLMGEVEDGALHELYSQQGAFSRVGALRVDLSMGDMNAINYVLGSFGDLARHLGMQQEYDQALHTMILGTSGRPKIQPRRRYDDWDGGYTSYSMDDFVIDEMARTRASMDWQGQWRNLLERMVRASDKDVIVVVIDCSFAIRKDLGTLLRQLEKVSVEGLCFLIQGRRDLLHMNITASYARRYSATGGRRLTEREAELADYNARHDLMRYNDA